MDGHDAPVLGFTEEHVRNWSLLAAGEAMLKERGRPRKNVPGRNIIELTWSDLGITRKQAFEWRRMAEVPEDEIEAIFKLPYDEMNSAIRRIKSGKWRSGAVDTDAHIRIPRELFVLLKEGADECNTSVSDYTVRLLIRGMKALAALADFS